MCEEDFNASEGVLRTSSWCLGGTSGSCWGDSCEVGADKPEELTELDDIFSKVCPNITYLQYNNVSSLIETEEYGYSDYYGGNTIHAYLQISLDSLYERLVELELIQS